MEKALFSISCTTCQARLAVRNEQAIGAILECPKCESMVQVTPPEGWVPEPAEPGPTPQAATAAAAAAAIPDAAPAPARDPSTDPASVESLTEPTSDVPSSAADATSSVPDAGSAGLRQLSASAAELRWRKWILWGAAPLIALVVVLGLWSLFSSDDTEPATEEEASSAVASEAEPDEAVAPTPERRIDPRWLPDYTAMVLHLDAAHPGLRASAKRSLPDVLPGWRSTIGHVIEGLGLDFSHIDRVTWASTGLATVGDQSVLVLVLSRQRDADRLTTSGEPVGWALGGAACYRLRRGEFTQPYAVVGPKTIVTAPDRVLRHLAERDQPQLHNEGLARLLEVGPSESQLAVLIDLAEARNANWQVPALLESVWPQGAGALRRAWQQSPGWGCWLQFSDPLASEFVLLGRDPAGGEAIRSAAGELAWATRQGIEKQIEALKAHAGGGDTRSVARCEELLSECLAALQAARVTVEDDVVRIETKWKRSPAALVAAWIDSRATAVSRWQAAVQALAQSDPSEPDPADPDPAEPDPDVPGTDEGDPTVAQADLGPEAPEPGVAGPDAAEPDGPQPDDEPAVREPLEPIDAAAHLAIEIPAIQLPDVPLAEAVGLLSTMSAVPVTFDPDALQLLGVSLRAPVSVELDDTTFGQALDAVVASKRLGYRVDKGHAVVTWPAEKQSKLWQRRYTIADITGRDATAAANLADVVRSVIAPESWKSAGGAGAIRPQDGALLVQQNEIVHQQILDFCEKLRTARGLPHRSRFPAERFKLDTRRQRLQEALATEVSSNFHAPAPLIEVLGDLGGLTEVDILLDRVALSGVGIADETLVSLVVEKQPMAAALQRLLDPLGLAYRAIDTGTLQVTTREAAEAHLDLEFYPAATLPANVDGPSLMADIRRDVAPNTWSPAGGPGTLHFDEAGQCLVVRNAQSVQVAVRQYLADAARTADKVAAER